ncbi:hypothetical protein [Rhizobium laguerreae]|uniref:hypothetical protein n=1 Tax=Rhizobium laguerreae TaxID=1076926 RepID=UPI001C9204DF|nr:hypothetical protein [Rhizobium laguerreae]MBY3314755.1 hypothetical protein [Rhizobium laguerreae]
MQVFEDISGDLPEQGQDSVERIVDGRPKSFLTIPHHDGQPLGQFLSEAKKSMGDAEATAPTAPSGSGLRNDEEAQRVGQHTDGWIEAATQARAEDARELTSIKERDSKRDEGYQIGMELMKRSINAGQDAAERGGARQHHSAAQAAALAEESMKRNAARPSTPTAGRTI